MLCASLGPSAGAYAALVDGRGPRRCLCAVEGAQSGGGLCCGGGGLHSITAGEFNVNGHSRTKEHALPLLVWLKTTKLEIPDIAAPKLQAMHCLSSR